MMEIILTSSVLILLLAVLRRALRGRIHPCVQYALWLLVAARLLIPGTLFEVPVSVMGAVGELGEPDQWSVVAVYTPSAGVQSPPSAEGPSDNFPSPPREPSGTTAKGFTVDTREAVELLQWIWRAGAAVTGGVLVLSNLIFARRLRKHRKRLELPDAPWSGDLPVYEADDLPSPCLFGVFRPAIYLNEAAMEAEHPEHILTHEYAHYCHGDHLWAVLRSVCLALHWYNPLIWWAAAMSRQDCELACDASALRRLGEEERIDYGQTLLRMVSTSRGPAALLHTATTMTAGKRAMKQRIALIVRQPKMRKLTAAAVVLLACLLAACSFGRAVEAPMEPADVRETPVTVEVGQPLSSNSNDYSLITDPDEVARLWELYQSFEYDGAYDPTGKGGWVVYVRFRFGDEPDENADIFFTLAQHGLHTQDGQDLLLKDIDKIYTEFYRMSTSNPILISPFDPATDNGNHPDLDPGREIMKGNARLIMERIQSGADIKEWLPLMNYMDWGILAQAAVEAGMDEGDGSGAMVADVIVAIIRYVEQHGQSMTAAEYLYILSATDGLDGAVAEGYSDMIYKMYIANPGRFAYVVLEMLPEERQGTILDCLRYGAEESGGEAISREELLQFLEFALAADLPRQVTKITLHSPGESEQYQLVGLQGIGAVEFESENPEIATVDDAGLIVAISPGETNINIHYEGAGGPLDLICRVYCVWKESALAPAPQPTQQQPSAAPYETENGNDGGIPGDGVRYDDEVEASHERYSDEIAAFDRWFGAWMDGVSAAPAGTVTYDPADERSLYQAVNQYLLGYAGAYFGGNFARNVEDYDVQVYFAVPTDPGERFTVSYSVHAAAALALPDGSTYGSALDSRELQTVITPVVA